MTPIISEVMLGTCITIQFLVTATAALWLKTTAFRTKLSYLKTNLAKCSSDEWIEVSSNLAPAFLLFVARLESCEFSPFRRRLC